MLERKGVGFQGPPLHLTFGIKITGVGVYKPSAPSQQYLEHTNSLGEKRRAIHI